MFYNNIIIMVEAGDVIVKVNGIDVHRYTTKEVLKCLRLSGDCVTLNLRRDPEFKSNIREQLSNNKSLHFSDFEPANIYNIKQNKSPEAILQKNRSSLPVSTTKIQVKSPCRQVSRIPQVIKPTSKPNAQQSPQHKKSRPSQIPKVNLNGSSSGGGGGTFISITSPQRESPTNQPQSAPPFTKARCEAYMMTGDLMLNLSRTPQSSNLIATHSKKVDSLRDSPNRTAARANGALAPRASGESTPSSSSSPSHSEASSGESVSSSKRKTNTGTTRTTTQFKEHLLSNNSNSNYSSDKKFHQDSLINDTLVLCEDIERDEERYFSNEVDIHMDDAVADHNEILDEDDDQSTNYDIDLNSVTQSKSHRVKSSQQYSKQYHKKYYKQSSSDVVDCQPHHNRLNQQISTTSSSSSTTARSDNLSTPDETGSFSVPTSPISLSTPLLDVKETAISVPTSPEQSSTQGESGGDGVVRRQHNGVIRKCDAAGFRTSKSEDHLQQVQREGGVGAVIPIDIDEDVNSSLNTLLDTRQDSEDSQDSNRDRIVWTYNAPVPLGQQQQPVYSITSPHSHSSSISTSPQHSDSPASPTSVSSSVMSSSGSKGAAGGGPLPPNNLQTNNAGFLHCPVSAGDHSVSEAVSNISSPDYQDDDNLLSSRDLVNIALSDPSDSDSTIMVSDAVQRKNEEPHKVVIQVKGMENVAMNEYEYRVESTLASMAFNEMVVGGGREYSPPVSDDGSDVESLHSYHYSPKGVDIPSAVRLAKRLYSLDGFKKSDVSRHLSKNNEFSRAVAEEFLNYFNFDNKALDQALREFLKQFSLSGETQERERVLLHFSKRYLDCNPGSFNSQDAVHTLTCAIMLLNTDLHGQNIGHKMTCAEFIDNLDELNDGKNFPKDVLKYLYQAIKSHPLEWALDDEPSDANARPSDNGILNQALGSNPFLDTPLSAAAIEYKKGYVMRKCCFDANYKKTPFGKRSWKMFYCTLRDLVLYLHKDEHGFRKNQMSDNLHNAIRLHHALATKAADYTKKQHVFRLQTADQAEYLFQTSDSKELQSWVDTINLVCASFSAPPLEGGVGSQKRFQRPLLPSTKTKFMLQEQLQHHENQAIQLENSLEEHKSNSAPSKGLPLQNYKEKEAYLQHELKRYKTYSNVLNAKLLADQQMEIANNLHNNEDSYKMIQNPQQIVLQQPQVQNQQQQPQQPQQRD
ncbi:efa-6 family protein [Megaselia abdita]